MYVLYVEKDFSLSLSLSHHFSYSEICFLKEQEILSILHPFVYILVSLQI